MAGVSPSILAPGESLRPGAVIVHSSRFDAPAGTYGTLETGGTVRLGSHEADTVGTPSTDAWVLQVR